MSVQRLDVKPKLRTITPSTPKPRERIIVMLREALKLAKSGELQGLAIALAVHDPEGTNKMTSRYRVDFAGQYKTELFYGLDAMRFSLQMGVHQDTIDGETIFVTPEDE